MSGHEPYTPEQMEEAARSVVWWPAALALVIVGLGYSLVSQLLTIGPPWFILAAIVVASAAIYILRWRGRYRSRRIVALAILSIVTVALAVSAVFLLISPKVEGVPPVELLRDAMLLWASNILTFGLWYWEIDGDGPLPRLLRRTPPSTDFAFPPQQQAAVSGDKDLDWAPQLIDYMFLAFTSSSTFGPTDTLVMARRAKLLMMLQATVSLVIFGGLVARAVGNLQ